MNQPLPITASIDVAAPPETVWAAVSDVRRMSEWSPECRRIFVVGSPSAGAGTRLLGINKRGRAVWPTWSRVVRFEPGRAVAWKVRESGATWTYEVEPTETGTRLTGRRDLDAFSPLTRLAAPLIGGATGHDRELTDGIRTTLERIKTAVEQNSGVPSS
ncbi:MAG TPA: SRPBCC family protein [Nocardioidaceae bacterium]|nr:SRPBCC family protein [Nocardioidaceae bacterium]